MPFVISFEYAPDSNLEVTLIVNDTSVISLDRYDLVVRRRNETQFTAKANQDYVGRVA